MRLLQLHGGGKFSLVEYFNNIPPYAILSHTWGEDDEEVTFKDIDRSRGRRNAGYSKLLFCAKQAENDHLHHIWVDTCCIDKSSSAELAEAINSMFSWYQRAAKCYVLLSDYSYYSELRMDSCRWFTRGWTLQELIAPSSVEFFSAEGSLVGSKESLHPFISASTSIPAEALQGAPLWQFSIDERMTWAMGRQTKREEDAAYSLLGLFDVHMPLIYGEGRTKAFNRLRREIANLSQQHRH